MKILVAYDGSDQAQRVLDWATRMGNDSAITVISVAPTLAGSPPVADAIDPTSDLNEHRRELDEAVGILEQAGVSAETVLTAGNPAEEIINAAAEGSFDMILIGIRGMTAVRRFLIGSVADRVVRHATVPVLVIR